MSRDADCHGIIGYKEYFCEIHRKCYVMPNSDKGSVFARIFDRLPLLVAVGLGVSACAFAAVVAFSSISGSVTYATLSGPDREAVVRSVDIGEDSVLTIPGEVGMPWDRLVVCKVENHAFEGDSSFTDVRMPEGLKVVGYSAFYGCRKLRRLNLPDSVVEVDDGAFYGCSSLEEVRLSPNISVAGEYIFERCINLKRVDIPEGVTSLPRSIFCACSSLKDVKLPSSLESIEPLAFKDCASLTEISLPEGLRYLGGCAFEMCTSLRRIVIPPHVGGLGVTAFNGCTSLTEVVSLSATPPPLGSSVFDGISSEATLFVAKGSIEAYRTSAWGDYFHDIREIQD